MNCRSVTAGPPSGRSVPKNSCVSTYDAPRSGTEESAPKADDEGETEDE